MKDLPILKYFFDKSFLHYLWVSALFSVMNIFLLWLFIDIFHIATLIASTVVIVGTFLLRYLFFKLTNIL